jgi:hypothetical protein
MLLATLIDLNMILPSHGAMRPEFCISLALQKSRAQGRPDARCTRGLAGVSANKNVHTSIPERRRTPGLPRGDGAKGIFLREGLDRLWVIYPTGKFHCAQRRLDLRISTKAEGFALEAQDENCDGSVEFRTTRQECPLRRT